MKRITVIDFMRGLVMVIMALDHLRDLTHISALVNSPTDLTTTTPALFMTRWITHLCAPIFVFLSGTSVFLSFHHQQNRWFLVSRGIWLILLELTVISLGIWFDIRFRFLMLQVIFTIGTGFILLSFLLKLRPNTLGIVALIIIFGHNLLQGVSFEKTSVLNFIWALFFKPDFFSVAPQFKVLINYPIIPWFGVMLFGYSCGQLFLLPVEKRRKYLWQIGSVLLLLFTIIRFTNMYGDPSKWTSQSTLLYTLLSFINITKYPPSLLYTLSTLGIMFLVFAVSDGVKNKFTETIAVYGKVPLFYYIIHWYLLHLMAIMVFLLQGFHWKDFQFGGFTFGRPSGGGIELPTLYLIWLGVVLTLYPICKWYGNYKATHRENKLLRYL